MNYYSYNKNSKNSRYKGARNRLAFNILIIIAIILAVVAFSIGLGNHLRHKLESAEINRDPVETMPKEPDKSGTDDEAKMSFKNDRTSEELSALEGYLDLSRCPDDKTAVKYVEYLGNVGYTGIVFNVFDDEGKLTYDSKAAGELAGTLTVGTSAEYEYLAAAVAEAKRRSMRVTAVAPVAPLSTGDEDDVVKRAVLKAVVYELGEMGFDEFIFKGAATPESFTTQRADEVFPFVSDIREKLPDADIGVVLDTGILDNPELTPVLELFFRFCDFFAIDFENAGQEEKSAFLASHSGSMSAYALRFFSGASTPADIASEYALYSAGGTLNISFVRPLEYTESKDEDGNFMFSSKMIDYTVDKGEKPKED